MKKLITAILLLMSTFAVFGAYQYENFLQLNGSSLLAMKNADISLTFQSAITQWSKFTTEIVKSDGSLISRTVDIAGNTINIGDIAAGDSLKFILENAAGQTTTSNMAFWGTGWDSSENTHEYLHFGANYGEWGGQYTSQQFQVSDTLPTGQPLPGVMSTLLLAGIVVGWMKFKKPIPVAR